MTEMYDVAKEVYDVFPLALVATVRATAAVAGVVWPHRAHERGAVADRRS
jgi:hypothetical protein